MPPFGNVKYVGDSLERACKGAALSTANLLDIARAPLHEKTDRYSEGRAEFHDGAGRNLRAPDPDRPLEEKITRAILAEDLIADEASHALAEIRRKIRASNSKITDLLQKYTGGGSMSKYLQENIVTTRGGRFVIPVKAEYRGEVKGLVHDTSASGATLFVEPMAVVDANNELRTLESAEKHEIERILAELSAMAAISQPPSIWII